MPKKGYRKNSKKMKQQSQENAARSTEKKKLKEMLEERDLFRPGMKIQEMRELCSVIQQSMLDHEVHQRVNQYNGCFIDEDLLHPILRDFSLLDNPASSENVNVIRDPSIPPTDASPPPKKVLRTGPTARNDARNFLRLTSPVTGRDTTDAKSSFDAQEDGDSDGEFYSPEFQGRCCRVIHVVEAEIHPEPRTPDGFKDDEQGRSVGSPSGIRSPRKQVKLPAKAWDTIDEVA
nr:uncharacterized protein LOC109413647 [Aedes albopictus]